MEQQSTVVKTAEFNPKIKRYLLLVVGFYLTISVAGIPLLLFWFLGLGQYLTRKFYENLKCRLTEKHLEFNKGFLFRVEKTIPLENIQDLTFIENPLLKALDLRILKIETAGQSNPQGSDMKLIGIINLHDFKSMVLNQRDLIKTESKQPVSVAGADQEQIVDLLNDIRNILNDIKNK